jgi:hypothetical protein
MKADRGVEEAQLHSFLNPALDGDEWLASRSGRFIPVKEPAAPINWEWGWVSLGAGLNVLEKR